ncbi:hypothetical protein ROLI_031750 [Roseobacter fucihabitans]|uniref:Polysaccharide deacetylase n=1 Tax=Roseobacter fucihabitans TaxID=1537242 RepID=A0ABZ2BZD7_9RHOB|nr:polysaccharide deacetylase [Roseobacter litoralis]MBC6964982.1 hypothetical protein [Roseobacter litoralis]
MRVDWSPLRRELALWRGQGLTLPLWWRDDDAVARTPSLDQLARMARKCDLPVHLAVIPARLEPSLIDYISVGSPFLPVVHGWAHHNTAPAGLKKAEFGHEREGAAQELAQALMTLHTAFATTLVRAFVAPWNRLHASYMPTLAALGYEVVSTFSPRNAPYAAPGLRIVNTHIDPIDWRGTRGLRDPEQIIAATLRHLVDRREGRIDNDEPFGYLTHHLVHTPDIWTFSEAFVGELLAGGAQPSPLITPPEEKI